MATSNKTAGAFSSVGLPKRSALLTSFYYCYFLRKGRPSDGRKTHERIIAIYEARRQFFIVVREQIDYRLEVRRTKKRQKRTFWPPIGKYLCVSLFKTRKTQKPHSPTYLWGMRIEKVFGVDHKTFRLREESSNPHKKSRLSACVLIYSDK